MNYRHAFHAGNFADCLKHAVLVWLLRALQRKPGAIAVLDTHAGRGIYDLSSPEAQRTGEWRSGIGRLIAEPDPLLADYVALATAEPGAYPGSPALVRALLRPQDRLIACELHPEEYAALRARYARDRQVAVHRRDAWEAIGALLPPAERRGLVLIDPPYEQPDDRDRLLAGLRAGHARFRTGVFAAWYPIKDAAGQRALHEGIAASGMGDVVAAELLLRPPVDAARLNGCGLLIVNPPWGFEEWATPALAALCAALADDESGAGASVTRLVAE